MVTCMAASSSSMCSTTTTTTTTTATTSSTSSSQQHPESLILVAHHHPSSMTIDIESHNKPQRKDVIDEFHKKIVHEDTERGDFKISIATTSSNGNSSHHAHTIVSVGSGGGGGGAHHQPQQQSAQSQQNPTAANKHSIERPPISRGQSGLPLTISKSAAAAAGHEPRLIPRSLRIIPLHVRFALNGLLSNVLFTVADNWAVSRRSAAAAAAASAVASAAASAAASDSETGGTESAFSHSAWFWMFWKWNLHALSPSAIYSILYLIFIPISHAMACIFVFGWPERYLPSLLSNCPIGLCALILGATLTEYLNSIQFNNMVVEYLEQWAEYIRNNFTFHEMPRRGEDQPNGANVEGQLYTSLAVLFVTNLWTYLSSLYVNSVPQKSEKKEL